MGFGLTAAPLLAVLDPHLVPVPALVIGFASSTWGAWNEKQGIAWNEVFIGVWGRAAGVVIAAIILANLADKGSFVLIFGAMILLAVMLSSVNVTIPFNRTTLLAMSTVSGLMGTITSVGAPPLALIYHGRTAAKARPTLAAFFAIGCALSLVGLYVSGWFHISDFHLALIMAPGMMVGLATGKALRHHFDRRYRAALLSIAAFAAIILIARELA